MLALSVAPLAIVAPVAPKAGAWEYSPSFCEFALAFPEGGSPPRIVDLDLGGAAVAAQSASVGFGDYILRAQCSRYSHCVLHSLTDDERMSTLRETAPAIGNLRNVTLGLESTQWGRIGLIDANMTADDMDFLVKVRVIWGDCTRLVLTFATVRSTLAGMQRWIDFYKSADRREAAP